MAQRQFRSDDTNKWREGFGNGVDGANTISADATYAQLNVACTGTAGTRSLSATSASFAAGQLLLIHQTKGTGAGNWELNKIASYVAGTITTAYDLMNTYAAGAQVVVIPRYTTFTVDAAKTFTVPAWDGTVGGIMVIFANSAININGALAGNYKGFVGGLNVHENGGYQGNSPSGDGSISTAANGMGGGGGGYGNGASAGAGGGGGHTSAGGNGQEGSRTGGTGGSSGGASNLTLAHIGAGGGGGGFRSGRSTNGGNGGKGGAFILLVSPNITYGGSANTTVAGGKGANAVGPDSMAGGGGGAGGSILLKGQTVSIGTNLLTAVGGVGGDGISSNQDGGAGSLGRIHVDYSVSLTGSSATPSTDWTQDNTIRRYAGGASLLAMMNR